MRSAGPEVTDDSEKEQTRRLQHVSRLYAVLSAVNRTITRRPNRQELPQEICRVLVETGGFCMAWFGVPDAAGWVIPEATFGDITGYLATTRISILDIPEGRGPTGTALRENRPVICNNIPGDPVMYPWRHAAQRCGYNANAAFPVRLPSGDVGALVVYSSEHDFFSPDEEKLVAEICADIGYALEFAATEERRAESEANLERERLRLRSLVEELTESEQKFRSLSNVAQDAIILLDDQDLVTFWNPAAERTFGYRADEIVGRRLHPLLTPPRYRELHRAAWGNFIRTGEGNVINRTRELSALRKNGEEFPVELSLSCFRHGGHWHAVGILRDITERKRSETAQKEQAEQLRQEVSDRRCAQELLLHQQQELESLNLALEERVAEEVNRNREKDRALMHKEKMVSLGQLAAGLAHEINNPLGYIATNLQVLSEYFADIVRFHRLGQETTGADEPGSGTGRGGEEAADIEQILEDGVDLIRETQEGTKRVTTIIQDMKSFSRMDASDMQPVALDACLEKALTISHNELKYVATIRKEIEPGPPVLCHPGQLNQVFLNLLVNAGQAMESPGVITIRCHHDAGFVYASVSDTGKGIPEEVRERIFDPFFTTKEDGKGTGLGLSISRDIIKKHRGELLVESVVGAGTTFTVKLPRITEEPR